MADIQYDPACMDCRHDAVKDPAGTTWQCNGHVRAERDLLRMRLANVRVESERADRSAAAWKRTADQLESEVASLRSDTYALRTENGALRNERNAALTLAEQRGVAYDMTRREVESLREWKDKLEGEKAPPPADAGTEAVREAAEKLLTLIYLYPNYRVDSRGPSGLIVDALEVLAPDLADRLREGETPDALLSALSSPATGKGSAA